MGGACGLHGKYNKYTKFGMGKRKETTVKVL